MFPCPIIGAPHLEHAGGRGLTMSSSTTVTLISLPFISRHTNFAWRFHSSPHLQAYTAAPVLSLNEIGRKRWFFRQCGFFIEFKWPFFSPRPSHVCRPTLKPGGYPHSGQQPPICHSPRSRGLVSAFTPAAILCEGRMKCHYHASSELRP
jgi:hypothetical protein